MKNLKDLSGLYSLSKTLKFELKPIGKTAENIKKRGLIENDQHRYDTYKDVKKIIDNFHKNFLEQVLGKFKIKYESNNENDSLLEYEKYYNSTGENRTDNLKKVQENLRKQVSIAFTGKSGENATEEEKKQNSKYKDLFGKKLLNGGLDNFVNSQEKKFIDEFKNFTTYFSCFYENRKNIYSAEEKSTSISYRLINDNLPKFVDNIKIFNKVVDSTISNEFAKIYSTFKECLNVNYITEIFNLSYYNSTLTQTQIDVYNNIVGVLNGYINIYNQQQKNKTKRLPKLKQLFKQILSDKSSQLFLDEFSNNNEVLDNINKYYQDLKYNVLESSNESKISIKDILCNIKNYELDKIYLRYDAIKDISQRAFGDWSIIQQSIEYDFENNYPKKQKESEENYERRKHKFISLQSFSIDYIDRCVSKMNCKHSQIIFNYFSNFGIVKAETIQKENLFQKITNTYSELRDLLNTKYPNNEKILQGYVVEKIKNLLDAIKELQRFVSPLLGNGNESNKDECFYSDFTNLYDQLNVITPLYNKVRNFITRKPYSTDKIKLYFENKGQFLGGWVDSRTEKSDNGTQAGGYLFRKRNQIGEYDYYLGISSDPKLFRKNDCVEGGYERLDYYQPKSTSVYGSSYAGINGYEKDKQILNNSIELFVSKIEDADDKEKIKKEFSRIKLDQKTPSGLVKILHDKFHSYYQLLLKDKLFQKENERVAGNLQKTICSLTRISNSRKFVNTKFKTFIEAQNAIDDLCKEKVFDYFVVSDEEIEFAQSRQNKPLYLFKIINKDLSYAETFAKGLRKSRGTENLHTLYFKELMQGKQSTFDIGTGMVFYRRATDGLKKEATHEPNIPIHNKNKNCSKKESQFAYGLIKDKRYTEDKYLFHLSIELNYQKPKTYSINDVVNGLIKKGSIQYIIGIDRGERHLLYLSVIDTNGNLVIDIDENGKQKPMQYSLNEIINEYKGNTYSTNYHNLLEEKGDSINMSRKSWQVIENIKELKEGYLSQVIHKIAQLVVKYNAIVVLEDLNPGFKRKRQKVEKQVYQKFEKMLIDKLNYLVDKKKDPNEKGGLLHALQLSGVYNTDSLKVSKQSGILFYVPAWNTSKMDPTTGFVNLFDTRYENIEKSKAFFSKFESIRYNEKKDWFEFEVKNYSQFSSKADDTKQNWTICTYGNRIKTFRNPDKNSEWDNEEINLTAEFKQFFKAYNIDIKGNLKESIISNNEKIFFYNEMKGENKNKPKGILQLFSMILQMRNSYTDTKSKELHLSQKEADYLISPVMNSKGEFYDSRTCGVNLPQNADANGAYNIARKGLWVIEQIKDAEDLKKLKLAISNKEWLQFAQKTNNE